MKTSELKQIIKEEIEKILNKNSTYKEIFDKLKKVGIDYSTVDVEGIGSIDIDAEDPDTTGASVVYAEWKDGTPLTKTELNVVNESDEIINYILKLAFK
jgi:hypothetical protein